MIDSDYDPLTQADPVRRRRLGYPATFVVLAVPACAFSLLQSLVLPALPSLGRPPHHGNRSQWLLTAYLLNEPIATPSSGGSATWCKSRCSSSCSSL